jgi:serine/threonine-protein kinase RsbW
MVSPLDLSATALPTNVGSLRRAVRRWLGDVIADADVVDDLTLAVSEALENAADHAYADRPDPGTMTVRAEVDDAGRLVIRIVDDGSWRAPSFESSRGRGITMMEALADSAVVQAMPGGTAVTLTQDLG